MIVLFLLCVIAGVPTAGQSLDVCATCHPDAVCEDKSDGSGKVCNCKYGFVGNGRSFCQDKDECQLGANKICGKHTKCHNTLGSYYCKCLAGYSPSNNKDTFIPNDGTHCQDMDECRVTGQCGEGGLCRNLEGSYSCSCQLGYRVHNGTEPFRPDTDGASCRVVDCGQPVPAEDTVLLSVTGTTYNSTATFLCDEGFVWRTGHNVSVCGADGQWRGSTLVCEEVDCGSPPALPHSHVRWNKISRMGTKVFYLCNSGYHNVGKRNFSVCTAAGRWEEPTVLCQEILCGSPPVSESTELLWDGNTAPGSTVIYFCKKGFFNKGGHNESVCNENGQWTPPGLTCQEILCGDPPILPHTGQIWNGSFTPGNTVTYYCKIGFYQSKGNNVSLCTINGHWTEPNISCKEIQCGAPPPVPHSVMLWDNISTMGSHVTYQCKSGYRSVGERNVSVCTSSGKWDEVSLVCQEISCQDPVIKPHSEILWDGTSHIGSVVYYQCDEGYRTRSLTNSSVCGESGQWEDIDLWCEEISCGPPLIIPHTNRLWDHTSRPGSRVVYECMDGFYLESGNDVSVCSVTGEWGEISVNCQAKCGPVPFLANSEVVWHNRSVVIHRCVDGYHSWRGGNISVCGVSGLWQEATLKCIEIKPPINSLNVRNEKCVQWKAEKYEEDTEVYKVTYVGSRDYQRSFHNQRKQFLSSKSNELELCLNLLPVTNYSISITAVSARFTTTFTINTSLTSEPPAPVIYYREFETPAPTLTLRRSSNTLDPISLYQVFVLPVEEVVVFDCSLPGSPDHSSKPSLEYVSAQIHVIHVSTEMNFTVGDGRHYEGFYNAPLKNGRSYYIILRAVSQWKTVLKSSCFLWAKIKGTSYVLKVASVSAAASVGLVAMAILCGYSCIWFFKRT